MAAQRGPVLVDICGTQSVEHRDRGISRYIFEQCLAVEALAGDLVGGYLVNPDLALPGGLDRLMETGKVCPSDATAFDERSVLHVTSPYELSVPLARLVPADAPRLPLVTTLYDVIPERLADPYLADPGLRQRYRARHQIVREARAVLALSESTARDAVDLLGLDPARVTVAGAGVGAEFVPPASRDEAAAAAAGAVAGLRPPYALYTGGTDQRKNVEGLLAAWGRLPERLRRRVQLAVACALKPLERNHLEVVARRCGLEPGRDMALTGFVPDAALRLLYQGTELFIYPSRYEGYGLPVAEALASGAPVVAADRSCLPEIVQPPGLFDPDDPDDMAAVITAALTDRKVRGQLLERTGSPPMSWADVAGYTVAAYERVLDERTRRALPVGPANRGAPRRSEWLLVPVGPALRQDSGRLRVAFATPLPPQPCGVADYSYLLLEALREHVDVTALVDAPPHHRAGLRGAEAPEGVEVRRVGAIERIEALDGRFDAVVYSVGNSEFHTGTLAALRRRPGLVLAHDVRLTELYRFGPHQHPRAVPGGFHAAVQAMYGGRVPAGLGESGWLSADESRQWGVMMAREVIALAEGFLASSAFAGDLARLDADPVDRHKIGVLPLAIGQHAAAPPTDPARVDQPPLVASFGIVNERKQTGLVVEAFAAAVASAHPQAHLAIVGPASAEESAALRARVEALGLADRVTFTGWVEPAEYRHWLERATVAVQLRVSTNGETSAATGACLASGIPTVVTDIGSSKEIPHDAVSWVAPEVPAPALGAGISALLADPERRRALGHTAARYAATRSFAATAEALATLLEAAQRQGASSPSGAPSP